MKLKAPEGATSCSHGGKSYEVAQDGTVEVPDEALELLSHGYAIHVAAPASEANGEGGKGTDGGKKK